MRHFLVALACFATACSTAPTAAPPKKTPAPVVPAPTPKPVKPEATVKPPPSLMNPTDAGWSEKAPDTYRARFETSKGAFVIEVTRAWSPFGADRFHNLVRSGFYDDCRFFRVLAGFMAQFGISGKPKVSGIWRNERFKDDPVKASNTRGMISFATGGPNTRTTQVFINYGNNQRLDGMGFSPFGKIIEGMDVVDKLYGDYGEGFPKGRGPDQGRIQRNGNTYLKSDFSRLDYIKKATIEK